VPLSNFYVLNTLLQKPPAEAQHEVQSRLLLNVVVCQRAAVLELLAREDQALLVRRRAFLVLDLAFDCVNCVVALHLESDGLPRQGFHKDLHHVHWCLYTTLCRAFTTLFVHR